MIREYNINMAASRQKDLRRRPVHPGDRDVPTTEKEVEISEDEEEDEYNDPLVLKGSRPKGPAKPLSGETEVRVLPQFSLNVPPISLSLSLSLSLFLSLSLSRSSGV